MLSFHPKHIFSELKAGGSGEEEEEESDDMQIYTIGRPQTHFKLYLCVIANVKIPLLPDKEAFNLNPTTYNGHLEGSNVLTRYLKMPKRHICKKDFSSA